MIAHWSARAVRDRERLFDFIEARSIQGALSMDEKIGRAVELLAGFPMLGHKGRIKGTFEFRVADQIVLVYRVRPKLQVMEIVRLMHSRQDS
ncbi:type II toxin-antitoxin system RelE/ParE family toxin [Duganella sp. HH101]|uniref:type II toxin-antitoxin system RelE/ParE family toxin n=1 Tax=Duganella sp. HH101 TaxID=1781066 RepID=UPI000873F0F1|nr:type II toxin-antitoxin system RelE/ParE family toxin [Duganella sp. HH101]